MVNFKKLQEVGEGVSPLPHALWAEEIPQKSGQDCIMNWFRVGNLLFPKAVLQYLGNYRLVFLDSPVLVGNELLRRLLFAVEGRKKIANTKFRLR